MRDLLPAITWLGLYLLLVAAPLILLLTGPVPPGVGFWWDFSMALGFAGMVMMGLQFALTARFRRASAPFGIDIIYYFHRYIAVIAFALLLAHFLIIRIDYPQALGTLNPLEAPAYMSLGRLALLLFGLLIVTSLWRKPLRLEYERWRLGHAVLATVAFLAAVGHIQGVGYYIDAPWKQALWIAFTLFWVLLILYVRLLKPWRMIRRPWRVVEVRPERGRAWTLGLEPEGHAGLPQFAAGQFAWLSLRASPFQLREHPFSIASSATRTNHIDFTIKELGDFTRTIKTIRPGEIAYLDGPYGVFSSERYPDAPGLVFIAGGVGIAPLMSMLRTAAARGERRPVTLIYANKQWDSVIFREELETLRHSLNLKLVHVLNQPPDDWTGEHGYVDEALLARHLPAERSACEYFLCGPKPMTDAVQQALRQLKVPVVRIHFELFEMV